MCISGKSLRVELLMRNACVYVRVCLSLKSPLQYFDTRFFLFL